ncbi:MAG: (2Fe-2S)-binding protein [Acidobacteria bacterium]|nr:(2Fe-2S)-binding protein [Acidobacteriota bacterium]
MSSDEEKLKQQCSGFSRRDFLKASGITLSAPLVIQQRIVRAAGSDVPIYGPGKVPVTLAVNGRKYTAQLEPRVTLLDALRNEFELTGAKRVCDRGTCGACTVLVDGKTVYSCSVLALEAQGRAITTVEGLMQGDRLHPIQQAVVAHDGQQCGFCTPGLVIACKALLDRHPNPTPEEIHRGLSGNLCRCGTYAGLKAAVGEVARKQGGEIHG